MQQSSEDGSTMAVGLNQSVKLIRSGKAQKVYLASDADRFFIAKVKDEIRKAGYVETDESLTAVRLGEMAGIEVPAAIITIY
ncbi:MAG: hypothetical protein E7674_08195 [Ruminococcaceae bacterium]|nr:hypothetical protein [Oscillospiraceae bacterium]